MREEMSPLKTRGQISLGWLAAFALAVGLFATSASHAAGPGDPTNLANDVLNNALWYLANTIPPTISYPGTTSISLFDNSVEDFEDPVGNDYGTDWGTGANASVDIQINLNSDGTLNPTGSHLTVEADLGSGSQTLFQSNTLLGFGTRSANGYWFAFQGANASQIIGGETETGSDVKFNAISVPEPASFAFVGMLGCLLGARGRRSRK